ncbi:hypothetical protein WJX72_010514 [[Myrmecia] bisecta]|uniref:Uncharacterized protein n=1 Tax=[Myrmecia] bisecta TaxID=41462 RepID=A0AAW1QG67_9CHLO
MPKLSQVVSQAQESADNNLQSRFQDLCQVSRSALKSTPLATGSPPDAQHSQSIGQSVGRKSERLPSRLHGRAPRLFRQPGGSLQAIAPPPGPSTVAARSSWAKLVQHCRDGAPAEPVKNPGLGIAATGREAGMASRGSYIDPLDDAAHAFNTYMKDQASAVLRG